MNNVRKYWLLSSTLLFVIVFSFLIVEIYTSTIEDEKRDYKMQQLEMAKNAASGISYFIAHLANDIKFLSGYPELRSSKLNIKNFPDALKLNHSTGLIRSVFFTNSSGTLLAASGEHLPEWVQQSTSEAIAAAKGNSTRDYIVSGVSRDNTTLDNKNLFFQILLPLISDVNDTAGYLGYMIDFNLLTDQYIKPLKLSKDDFAWIVDSEGTLVYHPNHEEMLFYSINETDKECLSCHTSFDMQKKILSSGNEWTGEYQVVKDEPMKLMAAYPIDVQDQKWMLVISASVPKVTENLRERFRLFFILGFVILGVIIIFSLFLYYLNLKRIRAEEARKNMEQVQLYQEQLNQASKMASIGELVDSVAHEINTPAGIIAAHTDGILIANKPPADLISVLQLIKKQTQRISDYTRSLLNYSQRIPFRPERVSLKYLLDECVYLLGHKFRAGQIHISKHYSEAVPDISADLRQIEQVFINLINNAIDASPQGSTIEFTITRPDETHEGVIVQIKDEGIGIPHENVNKIFNPFFSTKLNSNGTGLGLSIAKAIMQRHNGTISFVSEENKGTIFTLFFPINPEVSHE